MDFLLISQKHEIQPKMAEKGRNEKTAATPVTVATYQKTERNSNLEVGPIAKNAIFGPKMPKKCRFALRLATYCKSDSGL